MSDARLPDGRGVCFRRLVPTDYRGIVAYFEQIRADPASAGFRPHPFDGDAAQTVTAGSGQDMYAVGLADGEFVAYGMLRGWDAGYEVPSLGIYVSSIARGTLVSRRFMDYLHGLAAARGATTVRLTVDDCNRRAIGLYRQLGYSFTPHTEIGRWVGTVKIQTGAAT